MNRNEIDRLFPKQSQFELQENALQKRLLQLGNDGEALIDLRSSNPTTSNFEVDLAAIINSCSQAKQTPYTPDARGLICAREALVELYRERGVDCDAEDFVLTASTSEAYAHLFRLLCAVGDNVLISQPSYPLLDTLLALHGVASLRYSMHYSGFWRIDFDELKRRCNEQTRAIIIVSPHNPAGYCLSDHDAAQFAELGIPLIVDEVFADYSFAGADRPVLDFGQTLCFFLDGLSKTMALPQLKLAWIRTQGQPAIKAEALHRLEHINDAFLSAHQHVQQMLPCLLKERQAVQDEISARLRKNVDLLKESFKATPVSVFDVEAGWSVVIRLPEILSDEAWALKLLSEEHVWVHPGYFYDMPKGSCAVLSLLTPQKILAEGVKRILSCVQRTLQAI